MVAIQKVRKNRINIDPVLLYHPTNPSRVFSAKTPRELHLMYNQGYKAITPKKVGRQLKRIRRALDMSVDEILAYIHNQIGNSVVLPSRHQWLRLEKGHNVEIFSYTMISELARAFKLKPKDLYTNTPMASTTSKQKVNLYRISAFVSVEPDEDFVNMKFIVSAPTKNAAKNELTMMAEANGWKISEEMSIFKVNNGTRVIGILGNLDEYRNNQNTNDDRTDKAVPQGE